ncbi:hypothetical protein CAEBREN_25357 [Caenorhabditis brenneri]|uniref:Uncharacterized protein n=1 Tax=Caenorhabditis brenneri TaxID=135651 RepID=G0MGD7_CAEBE|nr:hypothetical protein CAEBREN_25357 [Caenorhabditis brenneri]
MIALCLDLFSIIPIDVDDLVARFCKLELRWFLPSFDSCYSCFCFIQLLVLLPLTFVFDSASAPALVPRDQGEGAEEVEQQEDILPDIDGVIEQADGMEVIEEAEEVVEIPEENVEDEQEEGEEIDPDVIPDRIDDLDEGDQFGNFE